jgi:integrase
MEVQSGRKTRRTGPELFLAPKVNSRAFADRSSRRRSAASSGAETVSRRDSQGKNAGIDRTHARDDEARILEGCRPRLPATLDFRRFRTMHSSLMSSIGVRPEVTRDNMGHATVDVTQNVYNRTWWEERVEAVSLAAATVWREFLAQPLPAARM